LVIGQAQAFPALDGLYDLPIPGIPEGVHQACFIIERTQGVDRT
jgi:hypothetical protein